MYISAFSQFRARMFGEHIHMRVLHVCNTAGVASVIAKYMDRLFGTESLVVWRKVFDPYGLTTYGELWDCGAKEFALKCLWFRNVGMV
jgi:hypothetical protein